jgi:hypothetical protein
MLPSSLTRHLRSLTLAALALLSLYQARATGIIMPIYGNTAAQFNAAVSAAQKVSMIAVINPDDGPSSRKVSGISNQVARLKGAGAITAGYISTVYGSVSSSSVISQIDRYVSWYKVNGIFLDEMSDRTGKISYYRTIYNHAKSKGLRVVGNPGTFVPNGYSSVADILVTYEDRLSAGWNSHKQASWTNGQPVSKFAAVVYSAPSSSMRGIVDRAIKLRYGWVFATDGSGGDPFGRAPSYIAAQADYVRQKNGGKK